MPTAGELTLAAAVKLPPSSSFSSKNGNVCSAKSPLAAKQALKASFSSSSVTSGPPAVDLRMEMGKNGDIDSKAADETSGEMLLFFNTFSNVWNHSSRLTGSLSLLARFKIGNKNAPPSWRF